MATVLVVDDEYAMAEAVEELLQFEGFQTAVANDGHEALELLRSRPIDLVVLDVMMPNLDGFGVLSAKHADESIREIPVILTSATLEHLVRERLEHPDSVVEFLRKPYSAARLMNAVKRALGRTSSSPPSHGG